MYKDYIEKHHTTTRFIPALGAKGDCRTVKENSTKRTTQITTQWEKMYELHISLIDVQQKQISSCLSELEKAMKK